MAEQKKSSMWPIIKIQAKPIKMDLGYGVTAHETNAEIAVGFGDSC